MNAIASLSCLLTVISVVAACDRRDDLARDHDRGVADTKDAGHGQVNDAASADAAAAHPPSNAAPSNAAHAGAGGGASAVDSGATPRAEAKFETAKGYDLAGAADFVETNQGVKVSVSVNHAPPGKKGIHIHEKPDCSNIPGKSMGEHFAPTIKTHALPDVAARHLGDLGNIDIAADGNGHLELFVPHATLKEGDTLSYLRRAVVIHESNDKGTQPSGGAGKPIACAIIEKTSR